MPALSVYAIRAAMLHLLLGFSTGAILLVNKAFALHPALWSLLPAHIDFLLFGWTTQLAMGVADWILPRFPRSPKRGNRVLAGLAFAFLNLGVILVALSTWVGFSSAAKLSGRALELAGIAA
ncbi:MAG: hypothetical protein PVI04_04350, partial [Anaerolineales bacterium]